MEILFDPTVWVGLVTLVVLEIVLGIDNLVFIAILADKLPAKLRDRARVVGLSLALLMRLGLLSLISWLATLTKPLFTLFTFTFSGRDLILLTGGIFLLFKATVELHERLDNANLEARSNRNNVSFTAVITQIVVLDAIFSLDAIITAVGIVNHLPVMMLAVTIAMALMLLASRSLTQFINARPTVVVLCLSFLLMIGLSLMAEGLGVAIPKTYLYAAIGFSILIESFNQIARSNFIRHQARRPMRERTAEAILRLMGERRNTLSPTSNFEQVVIDATPREAFNDEERFMMSGVLTLASRSLRSIMTPRSEVSWVDATASLDDMRQQLLDTPHSLFPVCRGELDELIGVVRAKELLVALDHGVDIETFAAATPPYVVPETLQPLNLLTVLRQVKGGFVVVSNEFGVVQGIITPLDILEAIAGEFPDEDETPDVIVDDQGWLVKGGTDLHSLQQVLDIHTLVRPGENYASLAGLLIAERGKLPTPGETISIPPLSFTILEVTDYRIDLVRIVKEKVLDEEDAV